MAIGLALSALGFVTPRGLDLLIPLSSHLKKALPNHNYVPSAKSRVFPCFILFSLALLLPEPPPLIRYGNFPHTSDNRMGHLFATFSLVFVATTRPWVASCNCQQPSPARRYIAVSTVLFAPTVHWVSPVTPIVHWPILSVTHLAIGRGSSRPNPQLETAAKNRPERIFTALYGTYGAAIFLLLFFLSVFNNIIGVSSNLSLENITNRFARRFWRAGIFDGST
ncbi:hypothetical protein B0H19DRAFT_1077873 [Mycena capillaripes]|nr:hypothetical protein B0H19DRAFT_1077873 [Mycena capillaripes]